MTSSQHLIMRYMLVFKQDPRPVFFGGWCLCKGSGLCIYTGKGQTCAACLYMCVWTKMKHLQNKQTISVLGWCCRSCCKLLFTWPSKTKRFIWLVCVHVCTIILWLTYMVNNFFVWWWGIDGFTSVGNQGDDGGCMTVRQQKEKVCQGIRSKKARTLLTHAL